MSTIQDKHLGGFSTKEITGDNATFHPHLWKHMVEKYKVKTVLDIGCGMGISTNYFKDLGCMIQAIEGHPYCKENSLIKDYILLHDYINGESQLSGTYDLCWSCEFVEHVEEKYSENFIKDFAKAKIVLITHATPGQGGWNHVNCQPASYWIERLNNHGLEYDDDLTKETREVAFKDHKDFCPDYISHYVSKGLAFKNKNL